MISASATVTTAPPARATISSTSSRCAGSAIRIAEAIVTARSSAWAGDEPGRPPLLGEALRVRGHVAAPAVRQREHVGRAAELLDDLERGGLLALDPVRVSESTSANEPSSASSRQLRSASSKLPRTSSTFAPTARDWASFAARDRAGRAEDDAARPARAA